MLIQKDCTPESWRSGEEAAPYTSRAKDKYEFLSGTLLNKKLANNLDQVEPSSLESSKRLDNARRWFVAFSITVGL
jgi:hypothetical protein